MDMRLILMRHGKAEAAEDGADDHARRLVDAGARQAEATAAALRERGYTPDAALCSDAARAVETLVAADFGIAEHRVLFDRGLYGGAVHTLPRLGDHLPADVATLVVVGHNPELEAIVRGLSGVLVALGTGDAAVLERKGPGWKDRLTAGWSFVGVFRG